MVALPTADQFRSGPRHEIVPTFDVDSQPFEPLREPPVASRGVPSSRDEQQSHDRRVDETANANPEADELERGGRKDEAPGGSDRRPR
jgi:hypothetical protein